MTIQGPPLVALVVDDEPDMQMLFRQQFRRELRDGRIAFRFATSGNEALAALTDEGGADIVLVLSDINMPGMSGLELLRRIKEALPALPVYMITAYANAVNVRQAQDYGAAGYLDKPIDFGYLREEVLRLAS